MSFADYDKEELKKLSAKGGKNGKKRERTEIVRSVIAKELAKTCTFNGEEMTQLEALVQRQVHQAIREGDSRSFNNLMNFAGISKLSHVEEAERNARVAKYSNEAKKAKAEIALIEARTDAAENEVPDDGFLEALESKAAEDWNGEEAQKGE